MRKILFALILMVLLSVLTNISYSATCYGRVLIIMPKDDTIKNVHIRYFNNYDALYYLMKYGVSAQPYGYRDVFPSSVEEQVIEGKTYRKYYFDIVETAEFCGFAFAKLVYFDTSSGEEELISFTFPLTGLDYGRYYTPLFFVEKGKYVLFSTRPYNLNYGQTGQILIDVMGSDRIVSVWLRAYEKRCVHNIGFLDGSFGMYRFSDNPFNVFLGNIFYNNYLQYARKFNLTNVAHTYCFISHIEVPPSHLQLAAFYNYENRAILIFNYTVVSPATTEVEFYLQIKYIASWLGFIPILKTLEFPANNYVINTKVNENYIVLPVQFDPVSNNYVPKITFRREEATYEKIRDSLKISFLLSSVNSWFPDSINVTASIKTETSTITRELTLPLYWDGRGYYYRFPDDIITSLVGKPFKINISNLKILAASSTLIDNYVGDQIITLVNSNKLLEVISYETFPLYIANSKLDVRVKFDEKTFYYTLEFDVFRNDTGAYVNNSICRIYRFYVGDTPNNLRLLREYPTGIGPIPFNASKGKYYVSSSYAFQEGQVTNNDRYFAIDVKCVLPDEFIYGEGETRIYNYFVFPINIFGFDVTTVEGMMSFFYFSIAFLISFLVGLFVRNPVFSFVIFNGIIATLYLIGYFPIQHFLLLLMISTIVFVMLVLARIIKI